MGANSTSVLGPITDAELRASAVPISGTVTASSSPFSTVTSTRPTISSVSSTALAANSSRKFAIVVNNSNATIYIKFGAAAVVGEGIALSSNGIGFFEINSTKLYTGAINAIKSGGGNLSLDVSEGT